MGISNALQIVETIPPGYLPLADVMRELKRSDSTIERLVASGQLRWQWTKRPGKKPTKVYLAEDVERLKREGKKKKAARPPSAMVAPRSEAPERLVAVMKEFMERVSLRLDRHELRQLEAPAPAVALKDKLWLSLDEAVEYSGLARADLLKQCRVADPNSLMPSLTVRRSGGWKILRKSLEAFEG